MIHDTITAGSTSHLTLLDGQQNLLLLGDNDHRLDFTVREPVIHLVRDRFEPFIADVVAGGDEGEVAES